MNDTIQDRQKTCLRCQMIFTCSTRNCWCSELPKVMPMSETEDCLCPECLEAAIELKLKTTE